MRRALPLLFALAGCVHGKVDFSERPQRYEAGDYERVLERWTRRGSLYRELASVYFVYATYLSWDWRQAFMARYQANFALSAEERRGQAERQRRDFDETHEIFVSFAPNDHRWGDLSRTDAKWHLTLLNERGEEVHPLKITRVRKITPEIREFFPYHGPFAYAFQVRFPKAYPDGRPVLPPNARRLTLRLAGAQGKAELVWEGTTPP